MKELPKDTVTYRILKIVKHGNQSERLQRLEGWQEH